MGRLKITGSGGEILYSTHAEYDARQEDTIAHQKQVSHESEPSVTEFYPMTDKEVGVWVHSLESDREKQEIEQLLNDEEKQSLDLFLEGKMGFATPSFESLIVKLYKFYQKDLMPHPVAQNKHGWIRPDQWIQMRLKYLYLGEDNGK